MWKVLGSSVKGSSHVKENLPCQDYFAFLQAGNGHEDLLLIGIADGAGSAKAADIGAREAVDYFLKELNKFPWTGGGPEEEHFREWLRGTQRHLREQAEAAELQLQDFACTLLIAAVSKDTGFFMQVGDGCWVIETEESCIPATWPSMGEFANYTKFITSDDAEDHLQFVKCEEAFRSLAGFTDGLQMLALGFKERKAHRPFFDLTKAFEAAIRARIAESRMIQPYPAGHPLCVHNVFVLGRLSRNKDADNMTKALLDALKTSLFADDMDIVHVSSMKVRHDEDESFLTVLIRGSKLPQLKGVLVRRMHHGWDGQPIKIEDYLGAE